MPTGSRWTLLRLAAALALLGGAFMYGFISHRNHLPPHGLLVSAFRHVTKGPVGRRLRARLAPTPPPRQGLNFKPTREARVVNPGDRDTVEALNALGYLQGSTPATGEAAVTVHKADLAFEGLNLAIDGHRPEAILMTMEAQVLHRWHYDFGTAFPDGAAIPGVIAKKYWRRVRLLDDGELLAIYEGLGLVKLDRDSNLIWAYPESAHHDVDVAEDGSVYVLIRESEDVPFASAHEPVLNDYIAILDGNGREKRRISLLHAFEDTVYSPLVEPSNEYGISPRVDPLMKKGDVLHTNTLELLDGRHAERLSAFRKGNVLVSFRSINTIAVLDTISEKIVWALSDWWIKQHQPTLLENGNILLFDNLGDRGSSRVVEIEPLSQGVAWSYSGRETGFLSKTCGSNQRLPNGNTLITESDFGRAFEVTPDHEVVWEYYTPHRAGEQNELIATLFEVVRLDSPDPPAWLD